MLTETLTRWLAERRLAMRRAAVRFSLSAAAICLAASTAVVAYPTSVNFIPTAMTVGSGALLVEFDNTSSSKLLDDGSCAGLCTEYGIGPRVEFGWDMWEDSDSSYRFYNGKVLVFDQSRLLPSAAVGVMDVADDSKPTTYTVLTRSFGSARAHIGWVRGSYTHGMMLGADFDLRSGFWLGVDRLPGDGNHTRLGVSHLIGSESYLTLAYGHPNNSSISSREISLTISTYLSFDR